MGYELPLNLSLILGAIICTCMIGLIFFLSAKLKSLGGEVLRLNQENEDLQIALEKEIASNDRGRGAARVNALEIELNVLRQRLKNNSFGFNFPNDLSQTDEHSLINQITNLNVKTLNQIANEAAALKYTKNLNQDSGEEGDSSLNFYGRENNI